jgi:hypothetical protein
VVADVNEDPQHGGKQEREHASHACNQGEKTFPSGSPDAGTKAMELLKAGGITPAKAPPLNPVNDTRATPEQNEAADHFNDELSLKSALTREHKSPCLQGLYLVLRVDPARAARSKNTDSAATFALMRFVASQSQIWRKV